MVDIMKHKDKWFEGRPKSACPKCYGDSFYIFQDGERHIAVCTNCNEEIVVEE